MGWFQAIETLRSLATSSIVFSYDFGFPHAVQACEPDGTVRLTFKELKEYIDPSGPIGVVVQ